MQGGKNWMFPEKVNANRFFWDSHWLEIWSNHLCPSMGPNGGSVEIDSISGSVSFRSFIFHLLLGAGNSNDLVKLLCSLVGVLDEPYSAKPAQRSSHTGPQGYIG
jgi:hypothetical protein